MADQPKVVTGLGLAELHRILVRGRDLTEDLLGNITFTDMVLFELSGRMPTANERRMIDALLVILVEHGMVASVVAARSTYHTAPEAIQGAVAVVDGAEPLPALVHICRRVQDADLDLAPGSGRSAPDVVAQVVADSHDVPELECGT